MKTVRLCLQRTACARPFSGCSDEALAFWMQDVKPEGARGTSYRPEKVLVHPAAWDGERAHLIAALDLQTKESV